jgi:hypothetical protein
MHGKRDVRRERKRWIESQMTPKGLVHNPLNGEEEESGKCPCSAIMEQLHLSIGGYSST